MMSSSRTDHVSENVMHTSSMISISCDRPPVKDIEVDICRNATNSSKFFIFAIYYLKIPGYFDIFV